MKALFRGNLNNGMKLVGVYENSECEKVAAYMAIGFPNNSNLLDSKREATQFVDVLTNTVGSNLEAKNESECTLLASGSLSRGIHVIGPYPNRNAALSNAIALNFGKKNAGYYSIEQAVEYQELRECISDMLVSHPTYLMPTIQKVSKCA